MSLAHVHSRCQDGFDAPHVGVEVHVTSGLPAFSIVGLPEAAVRESKERVRSALINSGFEFPLGRLTVNLAPGDIPKQGTRFDLAIALGILAASNQISAEGLDSYEFIAELALNGDLRPVGAALPAAIAVTRSARTLVMNGDDARQAVLLKSARVLAAGTLRSVCAHVQGRERLTPLAALRATSAPTPAQGDLLEVVGQHSAKRALEIAASGGHHLLFIGSPGTGKTMLAARLPGILPRMSETEAIETAALRSIAGQQLRPADWQQRPFRNPHHTCSAAALVGGGRSPRPGEISLAHNGVLFLDELPEFNRAALEALREPLETGRINVARARRSVTFSASFQLIAAMNPCPCGFAGDERVSCTCTPDRIASYRARISGPLADRIDLHVYIPRQIDWLQGADAATGPSTAAVRTRVSASRQRQLARQNALNANLPGPALERLTALTQGARTLLARAVAEFALSGRGYHRTLKVARTIADMADDRMINEGHVGEALSFRVRNERASRV